MQIGLLPFYFVRNWLGRWPGVPGMLRLLQINGSCKSLSLVPLKPLLRKWLQVEGSLAKEGSSIPTLSSLTSDVLQRAELILSDHSSAFSIESKRGLISNPSLARRPLPNFRGFMGRSAGTEILMTIMEITVTKQCCGAIWTPGAQMAFLKKLPVVAFSKGDREKNYRCEIGDYNHVLSIQLCPILGDSMGQDSPHLLIWY